MYDAYLFDLDGTIYLGDKLLPGAAETLAGLRAAGRRVIFLSNNPTKTRQQYITKLTGLGIPATLENMVNSSFVMVQWLLREAPTARLFVVGEEPLKHDLREAGFQLTEKADEIDIVVASFDRTFEYRKLQIAYDAIGAGARLVATNPDRYCPTPTGGEPDCAAIIAAIEACTGAKCDPIVGKPSPIMVSMITSYLGLPPDRCMMVGDRLETDIAMGQNAGMLTAVALSGVSTRADVARMAVPPTFAIERLSELPALVE